MDTDIISGIESEIDTVLVLSGVTSKEDIAKYINLGASGVQMATRFVATEECDASDNFKQAYVNAKKDDIKIRNNSYYNMEEKFDDLYMKSQKGYNFYKLMEII